MGFKREAAFLLVAALLAAVGGAYFYLSRATTLTLAVAPSGGTEPALLTLFAETLRERHKDIRLKVIPFDGVRESADALQAGKVDLAVVRPDIELPDNGLTLAILRQQAVLVAAPDPSGIKEIPELARKRLGFLASRSADKALIADLLEQSGLTITTDPPVGALPQKSVALIPIEEQDLAKALAEKRIDALVMITTPTTPAARRIVGIVQSASRNRKLALFGVPDGAATVERSPKLQTMTVPAALFSGTPKIPAEEVGTIGVSYRLMARSNLSRSVTASLTQYLFELRSFLAETNPAANEISVPKYESTADATSARLPIHPGAIDYYDREQESFIERYETWIYLVAFLGGGVGSGLAWLNQRLSRLRRERIEVATERLLEIRSAARNTTDAAKLRAMAAEIDDLAANIARSALKRHAEMRTMSAAAIAIDAARSTVRRVIEGKPDDPPQASKPSLRAVD